MREGVCSLGLKTTGRESKQFKENKTVQARFLPSPTDASEQSLCVPSLKKSVSTTPEHQLGNPLEVNSGNLPGPFWKRSWSLRHSFLHLPPPKPQNWWIKIKGNCLLPNLLLAEGLKVKTCRVAILQNGRRCHSHHHLNEYSLPELCSMWLHAVTHSKASCSVGRVQTWVGNCDILSSLAPWAYQRWRSGLKSFSIK